jgi:hypothetical protein
VLGLQWDYTRKETGHYRKSSERVERFSTEEAWKGPEHGPEDHGVNQHGRAYHGFFSFFVTFDGFSGVHKRKPPVGQVCHVPSSGCGEGKVL